MDTKLCRTLPSALLGILLASPAGAADIVVPDVTPATMGDFAVAEDLSHLVVLALMDQGMEVLAGEELERAAGDDAIGCADDAACPENLWARVGASQALVTRVEGEGSRLRIQAELWRQGTGVVRRWDESVPATAAGELLLQIADDIVPDGPAVTEVRPGVVDERYDPIEDLDEVDEDADDRGKDRDRASTRDAASDDAPRDAAPRGDDARDEAPELRGLGLPAYAHRRFQDSGLERDAWLEQARVRTSAVFIELHAGALFGDLDRRYDVRMSLYEELGEFEDRGEYRYESFLNSRGFLGGAALGYQVAWWLDASILGGVQLGRKELTTGWETWQAGAADDGSDLFIEDEETIYDPVSAVLGMMEPRFRLYPTATGPVKPYALVGFHLRFYDAYNVPDGEIVSYPEAGGGVAMGPTLGGGLAFDAPKGAVGFLEVPWTYVVVPAGPTLRDDGALRTVPSQFTGVRQFVAFKAGVAIHFR